MGDDDSKDGDSRKRAAEESAPGESMRAHDTLISTSTEHERTLRARRSMDRNFDPGGPATQGYSPYFSMIPPTNEQHLMELSQLQRLRNIQMLASARNSQQLPLYQHTSSSMDIGGQHQQRDQISADRASRFEPSLEARLNIYRAGSEASAHGSSSSSHNVLRDEVAAAYPLLRPSDELARISRYGSVDRTTTTPATRGISDYLDLLAQLRHQEHLNERLIKEAQFLQQQRRRHTSEQTNASIPTNRLDRGPLPQPPSQAVSMPDVPSQAVFMPAADVPRNPRPKKRVSQGAPLEAAKTYKPGIPLELPTDKMKLTTYQTLIRASLEYFKATQDDISTTVQGRRQKLQCGQSMCEGIDRSSFSPHRLTVGIRCKFCAHLPLGHLLRGKGSCSYPKTRISVCTSMQYGCFYNPLTTYSTHDRPSCPEYRGCSFVQAMHVHAGSNAKTNRDGASQERS